jgi:hypothetical protein
MYCHAGCEIESIMSELRLPMSALFDQDSRDSRVRIEAIYDYLDDTAALLFQVVRYGHKRFRQRRPDGCGGYLWNLNGIQRVPYRLPQLLTAVHEGQRVFVPEGEKDVHALERAGQVATCNPMGAGKWRPEFNRYFAGARVTIVCDKDYPGWTHAIDVADQLAAVTSDVQVVEARGNAKDSADHLAAGYEIEEFIPISLDELRRRVATATSALASVREQSHIDGDDSDDEKRRLTLTPASAIKIRPVRWLWHDRIAVGTLALLAGREGIGKSILIYQLAADLTRGRLEGVHRGRPKAVIVAATEDSWEHTIAPRLMAADADLELIQRIDVTTSGGFQSSLTLPSDLVALGDCVDRVQAALMLMDPLISRLDRKLDTYKDAEVRQALEPVVALADRFAISVVGLIHLNKSTTDDPLTAIMASRAFTSVPRSILFVALDPEDESIRILGQPKNNLGRMDLPSLTFTIRGVNVADTDEGPVFTGQLAWLGETDRTIRDVLRYAAESSDTRTNTEEAAVWLDDYLRMRKVEASKVIKDDGRREGHNQDPLKRARKRIGAGITHYGFPRRTYWSAPGLQPDEVERILEQRAQSEQTSRSTHGEIAPTALTAPTGGKGDQLAQSAQSEQLSIGIAPT